MVIYGQPGSGKSSLCRILAARLPCADFFPLSEDWVEFGPGGRSVLFRQPAIDAPRIGGDGIERLVLSAIRLQWITPDEMLEVLTAAPHLPVDRLQAQLHDLLENAMDESANKAASGAATEDLDAAHATEQYFVSLSQAVDSALDSSTDPL